MGEQTLTIIGFPNRFQIFRANNPSDVFTQKCLCTTQEYFLPLETESSEIEELEIRRKNSSIMRMVLPTGIRIMLKMTHGLACWPDALDLDLVVVTSI